MQDLRSKEAHPANDTSLIPQLTQLEQKSILLLIIIALDVNDVIHCAPLNEIPLYRKVSEEIKRRKKCISIYTWPSAANSSERSQGRLGHSALKTYTGGPRGTGVYVSFYPGTCDKDTRHLSCKKSVSHFHEWNLDSRSGATKIDLYGLDVAAINQLFQEMHDENMNSKKPWKPLYNCSDLVLELLEEGKLYERANLNPYSKVMIGLYSLIMGAMAPESVTYIYNFLFSLIFFSLVPRKVDTDANRLLNAVDYNPKLDILFSHPLFIPMHLLLTTRNVDHLLLITKLADAVIGALSSRYILKFLIKLNLSKKKLPEKTCNHIANQNLKLATIVGALPVLIPNFLKENPGLFSHLLSILLWNLCQITPTLISHKTLFPSNIIKIIGIVLYAGLYYKFKKSLDPNLVTLDKEETNKTLIRYFLLKVFGHFFLTLSIEVIPTTLYLHFFHRITTPEHILDTIVPIQGQLENQSQETKPSNNHYFFFKFRKEKTIDNTAILACTQEDETVEKSSKRENNLRFCTII